MRTGENLRNWILVVGVALSARAVYLLATGPDPRYALTADSLGYIQEAKNLSLNRVFSASPSPPFVPETSRTPAYPFFLAAICDGTCPSQLLLWVQAFLGALTAGLVYAAGIALWEDSSAAVAAGLGAALDAVMVFHAGLALTEVLFLFVFSCAFLLWAGACFPDRIKKPWLRLGTSGFLFGLSALVRPVSIYFFAPAALVTAWVGKSERYSRTKIAATLALFLAAFGLAPGVWMARNAVAVGSWSFTSFQGSHLFGGYAAGIEMELTGLDFAKSLAILQGELKRDHLGGFSSPLEESIEMGKVARRIILSHPILLFKVAGKDLVRLMGGHGMELPTWSLIKDENYNPLGSLPAGGGFAGTKGLLLRHPWLGAAIAGYLLFLVSTYGMAAWGLVAALREGQARAVALISSVIFYFLAVTVGSLAYYRYRIPLMPAVFLLAGRGCAACAKLRRNAGST